MPRSYEPEQELEERYLEPEETSPWIEALGDHVILEEYDPGENRTPTGLVIPANVSLPKGAYKRFRVVAVGPLCSDDRLSEYPEPSLHVGDIVLAPVDDLGTYRDGKNLYYIAHYELVAAVLRED